MPRTTRTSAKAAAARKSSAGKAVAKKASASKAAGAKRSRSKSPKPRELNAYMKFVAKEGWVGDENAVERAERLGAKYRKLHGLPAKKVSANKKTVHQRKRDKHLKKLAATGSKRTHLTVDEAKALKIRRFRGEDKLERSKSAYNLFFKKNFRRAPKGTTGEEYRTYFGEEGKRIGRLWCDTGKSKVEDCVGTSGKKRAPARKSAGKRASAAKKGGRKSAAKK